MDTDAFVAAHRAQWARLDELSRRRSLTGAEADELVDLYQRSATHLSVLRSAYPDPSLLGRLSQSIARARSAVTSAHTTAWSDLSRFVLRSFPAAAYRARWWWLGVAVASIIVAIGIGWWVAVNADVQSAVATPDDIAQLVNHDFATYYSSNPASSFATQVWTNNAWVAALSLIGGACLCLPAAYVLWQNAANVGLIGGLMASAGRLDLFFGLILPHGLLELTAVFLAAGAGIRVGWQIIDPGRRPRSVALATEGRAAITIAIGLVAVLLVSGLVEAFVTPSPLPTWARISIGALVWLAFLAYVVVLGRRAIAEGEDGDLRGAGLQTDVLPYAG
ncbi:MAG TPA: stage II sporulation protein M [Candidatus Nanopelagicales bacterium]